MKKPKGLGQGLGALFENDEHADLIENKASKEEPGFKILSVPIVDIEPNENQPRKTFDKQALQELASSIKEVGVIMPLIIRNLANGRYEIIAGERRWRAAKMAGLKEVPVIIKEYNDSTAAQVSLIENLQRQDLNIIEEALGYKSLIEEYNLTQEQVSKSVGKSRPSIANALRLLSLPKDVQKMIVLGQLSPGHAKAIVSLKERSSAIAKQIADKDLSVRQTEKLVKAFLKDASSTKPEKADALFIQDLQRELSGALKRKVTIKHGNKKGKLEIEYYGNEDLNDLIFLLKNI